MHKIYLLQYNCQCRSLLVSGAFEPYSLVFSLRDKASFPIIGTRQVEYLQLKQGFWAQGLGSWLLGPSGAITELFTAFLCSLTDFTQTIHLRICPLSGLSEKIGQTVAFK